MLSKIIIFTLFLSQGIKAQTVPGQVIKAETVNSSIFNVGDVRQAMLSELQFQNLNGSCWVQMKGQDVIGSDYASISGENRVPNADGIFLRTSGGDSGLLAKTQEEEIKSHTHLQNAHEHLNGYPRANGYNYASAGALNGTTTGGNTYVSKEAGVYPSRYAYTTKTVATNQNSGGESRPKNLTINSFIKINKNCN